MLLRMDFQLLCVFVFVFELSRIWKEVWFYLQDQRLHRKQSAGSERHGVVSSDGTATVLVLICPTKRGQPGRFFECSTKIARRHFVENETRTTFSSPMAQYEWEGRFAIDAQSGNITSTAASSVPVTRDHARDLEIFALEQVRDAARRRIFDYEMKARQDQVDTAGNTSHEAPSVQAEEGGSDDQTAPAQQQREQVQPVGGNDDGKAELGARSDVSVSFAGHTPHPARRQKSSLISSSQQSSDELVDTIQQQISASSQQWESPVVRTRDQGTNTSFIVQVLPVRRSATAAASAGVPGTPEVRASSAYTTKETSRSSRTFVTELPTESSASSASDDEEPEFAPLEQLARPAESFSSGGDPQRSNPTASGEPKVTSAANQPRPAPQPKDAAAEASTTPQAHRHEAAPASKPAKTASPNVGDEEIASKVGARKTYWEPPARIVFEDSDDDDDGDEMLGRKRGNLGHLDDDDDDDDDDNDSDDDLDSSSALGMSAIEAKYCSMEFYKQLLKEESGR